VSREDELAGFSSISDGMYQGVDNEGVVEVVLRLVNDQRMLHVA